MGATRSRLETDERKTPLLAERRSLFRLSRLVLVGSGFYLDSTRLVEVTMSVLTAVLAGSTCIGHVLLQHGQQAQACDRDDRLLGTFANKTDALAAVVAAASAPEPAS